VTGRTWQRVWWVDWRWARGIPGLSPFDAEVRANEAVARDLPEQAGVSRDGSLEPGPIPGVTTEHSIVSRTSTFLLPSTTHHPRHHSHHPICSACHGLRFPTSRLYRQLSVCWSLLGACSNGFLCETSIFSQTPLLVCRTTQRHSTSIPLALISSRTIVCDSRSNSRFSARSVNAELAGNCWKLFASATKRTGQSAQLTNNYTTSPIKRSLLASLRLPRHT
jgi:hypothetical protein